MKTTVLPVWMVKTWSEKRLLKWLFIFVTLIASIQFFQYYIFYNSSYPFPYLQNITASYGSFYTYFLFIPLIFKAARFASGQLSNTRQLILFHLLVASILSGLHLLLIHFLGWLQTYQWSEIPFLSSYRFLLSKWLHYEVMIYGFLVFIWRGLDYVRWTQIKRTEETAEPDKVERDYLTSIKVKDRNDITFIPVSEIRWIEAYDNYIKIRVNDRYFLVRRTLSGIEKLLDPSAYQRIHRSMIVAINEVENLRTDNGNYQVILNDGTTLKLSRTYKEALERRLNR